MEWRDSCGLKLQIDAAREAKERTPVERTVSAKGLTKMRLARAVREMEAIKAADASTVNSRQVQGKRNLDANGGKVRGVVSSMTSAIRNVGNGARNAVAALAGHSEHVLEEGMRVSHRVHGMGTVAELTAEPNLTRVAFDKGESHRYRPGSLHKLTRLHPYEEGARVVHKTHGAGTVAEVTDEPNMTRVVFDKGESHRYRPGSLHKLDRLHVYAEGMRVVHRTHGEGTVAEVIEEPNMTRVVFDKGESHRYRLASLHKLAPVVASTSESGPTKVSGGSSAARMISMLVEMETAARKTEKAEGKLQEVLTEILVTEANYIADMLKTTTAYLEPLKEILGAREHEALFGNLVELLQRHKHVEALLGDDVASLSTSKQAERIAGAFYSMLPDLQLYATYCTGYTQIGQALARAHSTQGAGTIIASGEKETAPVTFSALLFRPVQRLCQYPLLFRDASKYCDEGSAIASTLDALQDKIVEVNALVREQTSLHAAACERLSGLRGDLATDLLIGTRTLVHEEKIDMKCASGPESRRPANVRRPHQWFLLSDSLLICQKDFASGRYTCKRLVSLADVTIMEHGGDEDTLSGEVMRSLSAPGSLRSSPRSSVFGRLRRRQNSTPGTISAVGAAVTVSDDAPVNAAAASVRLPYAAGRTRRSTLLRSMHKTDKPEVLPTC